MLINILSYVLTVYMVKGIPSTSMQATNNILIQSKEIQQQHIFTSSYADGSPDREEDKAQRGEEAGVH